MKRIDATVRTSRLEEIVNRLRLIGVTGMTLAEVYGFGLTTNVAGSPGARVRSSTAPRYQLTIVVRDEDAAHIVNAITVAGRTESPGDGVVFVSDVVDVMRIRTGETGIDAL
jgi:nitrogen regulatory protein P-II 1